MSENYNFNIERAVLATVIFDPSLAEVPEFLLSHEKSLFFHPNHAEIFDTVRSLHMTEKPIDEEFVRLDLVSRGVFDEVAFLDVLAANPLASLGSYVHELERMERARRAVEVGIQMRKRLIEDGEDPDRVLSWASKEIESSFSSGGSLTGMRSIMDVEAHDPEFRISDWLPLPKGSVTLLSAPGGTGKSWLALQIGARATMEDRSLNVFLWLTEDPDGGARSRFDAVCDLVMTNVDDDARRRVYIAEKPPFFMLERQRGSFVMSPKFYALKRELDTCDLIVMDPLLAFFGGDENDNSQARLFMQPWMDWAKETGKSIVFIHHAAKGEVNGPKSRGAGAFVDAVRVSYEMEKVMHKREGRLVPKPSSLHMRKIKLTKDNWGAFKYLDGFEFERHVTPISGAREVEIICEPETVEMPVIS